MELVESIFYRGRMIDVYLIGLSNLYVVADDFGPPQKFASLKKAKAYVNGLH